MKRIRGLLKILIGLLALIIIGGFIILDRVDYTPYFETNYYQKTRARQDSLMEKTQLYSGALQIGFGRVNITPQIGKDDQTAGVFSAVPLAGYGDRKGASATGVHDSLYVSVIAIQVGEIKRLLVSADMLIIPTNLSTGSSELALKQLGIGRDQIFFSATHTHSSMGGLTDKFVGEMFGGKYNPGLEEWLIQQFCKAMDMAVADLQPGRMGVGSFDAAAHVRNRIVGDRGEEDSEFVMIRLEQNNGKKAVIGAFDGHATTLGGDNLLFSGDYPGFWRKALEETEIDFAVFFAGSVGSHSVDVGGDSFEKMETVGKALADSVSKYYANIPLKDSIELSSITVSVDLPGMQVRVSEGMALAPFISKKLFPSIGTIHVQAMRIGKLVWATAPADFSGELAIDLKNEMYRHGYYGLVSSFNGAYVGYVIPAKCYHYDQYEARTMSWFGPGINPFIEELLRRNMEFMAFGVK